MSTQASTKRDGSPSIRPGDLAGIPASGEMIAGKLRVERILGVGGMGVVLAAEHIHLRQSVAVKLLRADIAEETTAVARFLREARAMGALRGVNIVRVLDVGTLDTGLPYMVMERLVGRDLGELVDERGKLTIGETVDYVLQGCVGIAEAHAAGIVHRDLKPSNLFLTSAPDGAPVVKVLDFGVSKVVDARWDPKSLTDTATIVGSPAYMSPEQIRSSKTVDGRTDIWALGVCLYRLASGLLPFSSDSAAGMCAAIILEEPTPLTTVDKDVPPAFEAIVRRCMEKDVTLRFQTVLELASALRMFASTEGAKSVARVASAAASTFPEAIGDGAASASIAKALPRTGGARVAIAIALVVGIGVAIALVASRASDPPTPSSAGAASARASNAPPPIFPLPPPIASSSAATPSPTPSPQSATAKPPPPPPSARPTVSAAPPASDDDLIKNRR